MPETARPRIRWFQMILLTVLLGCGEDKRLVALSRESLERQAEQNQQMARQTETVAAATKQLVESEADLRRQTQELHQQLHAERQSVDRQHEDLEKERQRVAAERQREPIIAETISGIVGLLVAALPLVVCWYLVRTLFLSANDDVTAAEIVIEQLVTQGPLLSACAQPLLPGPSWTAPLRLSTKEETQTNVQVVVVLEGTHDVEFLKRMSRILSADDPTVPDLNEWEAAGRLAFVVNNGNATPFPAGTLEDSPAEFHLLDREMPPISTQRGTMVRALNARPNTLVVLTNKRAIENYLHPEAIREAGGVEIPVGDCHDVAELVAKAKFRQSDRRDWESLSRRSRRRLRDKAKRWLNQEAVERMTPRRLSERDPDGEVTSWLRAIAELAGITISSNGRSARSVSDHGSAYRPTTRIDEGTNNAMLSSRGPGEIPGPHQLPRRGGPSARGGSPVPSRQGRL